MFGITGLKQLGGKGLMKRLLSLMITLALLLTSFPAVTIAEGETPISEEPAVAEVVQEPEPVPVAEEKPKEALLQEPSVSEKETVSEKTAQSETPAEKTETPVVSETPSETEEPAEPETPVASETPSETEEPAEPEAPVAANLSTDVARLDFGVCKPGDKTAARTIVVTNRGNADAALTYSELSSFVLSGAVDTLAAGQSVSLSVAPKEALEAASYTETLRVAAEGASASVELSVLVSEGSSTLGGPAYAPILPNTPTDLIAEATAYNAVTLTWTDAGSADSFNVYYSTTKYGTYNSYRSGVPDTTLMCNTGLTCGTTYYFKVTSVESGVESALSEEAHAQPRPVAPSDLAANATSMTTIRLSWMAMGSSSGVSGYNIYYRTQNQTRFTLLTQLARTRNYYDHTGLTPNNTYTYYIVSYWTNGTKNVESEESEPVEATPELPSVPNFQGFSAGVSGVKLTWARVPTVTGYVISRATTSDGVFEVVYTVPANTTLTWTDTDPSLITGTEYTYAIHTYYQNTDVAGPDVTTTATPKPNRPTGVTATSNSYNSVKLTCAKVQGTNGYQIYRRGPDEDAFSLVYTVPSAYSSTDTTFSYVDNDRGSGLQTGKQYFYYIKAYRTVLDQQVPGTQSVTVSARPKPNKVTGLAAEVTAYNTLDLTWDVCSSAQTYQIEYSTDGSNYSVFGVTDDDTPAYQAVGLISGRLYYFRVAGRVNDSGVITYGTVSNAISARPVPGIPTGLTATCESATSVCLRWNDGTATPGASGYRLYRSTSINGNYTLVATITPRTTLYYVNTGLVTAQTHYYKIASYVLYANNVYTSEMTDFIEVTPVPGKPVISSVVTAGCTQLKVTWGAISGVTGYNVMYATSEDGDYTTVDVGNVRTYTLQGVQAGEMIYIKVQAYTLYNNVKEGGEPSDVVSNYARPTKVTGLKLTTQTGGKQVLTWTTLQADGNAAGGYFVYVCDKDGSNAVKIGEVLSGTTGTFTLDNSTQVVGDYYFYKVTAFCTGKDGVVTGTPSAIVSGRKSPSTPTHFAADYSEYNSLALSWDEVDGATGYEIYYSSNTSYVRLTRIGDVAATTYLHSGITPGRSLNYKIRAYYRGDDGAYLYSPFSDAVSRMPLPLPPTDVEVKLHSSKGIPLVSWVRATGAQGYGIYYSTSENGTYTLGAVVTKNINYGTVSGLTAGQTYYFKVKSRVVYNGVASFSVNYSTPAVSIVPSLTQVTSLTGRVNDYQTINLSWSAVKGAAGYEVRVTDDDGNELITPITTGATSCTVQDKVLTGRYIRANVYAYCYESGSASKLYSPSSPVYRTKPKMSKPASVKATALNSTSISIRWSAVPGAEGYRIRRRIAGSGYELVTLSRDSETLEWQDDEVCSIYAIGTRVYYIVEAWVNGDGEDLYGTVSAETSAVLIPDAPQNISAAAETCIRNRVEWDSVSNATGYRVYRSTSATSGFTKLVDTTNNFIVNSYLGTGTTYYYRVRAFAKVGTTTAYSPYTSIVSAKPEMGRAEGLTTKTISKTRIRLFWEKTYGASGYYIYRSNNLTGTYMRIATVTSGNALQYTNINLQHGTTYYYKVSAYRTVNGRRIEGTQSLAASGVTIAD